LVAESVGDDWAGHVENVLSPRLATVGTPSS
jgi:hypothetical protein